MFLQCYSLQSYRSSKNLQNTLGHTFLSSSSTRTAASTTRLVWQYRLWLIGTARGKGPSLNAKGWC